MKTSVNELKLQKQVTLKSTLIHKLVGLTTESVGLAYPLVGIGLSRFKVELSPQ